MTGVNTAPSNWKEQIDEIIASPTDNNTVCADCCIEKSDWSVWNLGVFVCIKCAGFHRQLGVHISKVKSTQFDKWKNNELLIVKEKGNKKQNKIYEKRKPAYFINPSQCLGVDDIRRYFITQKYDVKLFMNEMKNDPGTHDMPQKVYIGTFLNESNKKKIYFQLLGHTLYYFRYNHDSYHNQTYNVIDINATISLSDVNNVPFILKIYQKNNDDNILYKLRPYNQNINYLIDWVHAIRRSSQYYIYLDNNNSNDDQKNNQLSSNALKEMNAKDLQQGTILGIASKKGGGARSWRKRWWVLINNYLYYFKEDFRKNKKLKGIGIPQGNILLYNADIIWDTDRSRTGKQNALMICTKQRTFYIQPQSQTKNAFFNAVNGCCNHLWDRKPFDFVANC